MTDLFDAQDAPARKQRKRPAPGLKRAKRVVLKPPVRPNATGKPTTKRPVRGETESEAEFAVRMDAWREQQRAYDKARYHQKKTSAEARAKINAGIRDRLSDPDKRAQHAAYQAQYRVANPDKVRGYSRKTYYACDANGARRERYANDELFRLMRIFRVRLRDVLRAARAKKSARSTDLVGCSLEEFRAHIEAQWQPWMTWQNYGKHTWHVDHIVPCAAFNLRCPLEQVLCFGFWNLRPLPALENWRKGDKFEPKEKAGEFPHRPLNVKPVTA